MENKKIIIITIVLFLLAGTGTFVFASNQGNFNEEDIDYRTDKEPTYNKVENNNSNNNANNSNEGNTTPIPNPGITNDPLVPDNNSGSNSETNATRPGNTNNSSNNSNQASGSSNNNNSNNSNNNNANNNQGSTSGNTSSDTNKPADKPAEPEHPVIKDTTPPILNIKYNTTTDTKGPVIATITSNEPIKAIADWSLSNDKLSMSKAFANNENGYVTIYDEAGNSSQIEYNIQNIDNIAPKVTVETSNNNGNKSTFRDITVTITADEDIKPVLGWNLAENRILTKTFSNIENAEYNVKIYDLVGNETEVKYEIKKYDPTSPEVLVEKGESETTITMTYKEPLDDTWVQNENGEYVKVETIPNNNDKSVIITMPDGTIKVFDSAPNVIIKISNQNADGTSNKTNQPVEIRLEANKEVQELEGWTLSEDHKTLFKTVYEVEAGDLTIYDLAGNSTNVKYSITNVDAIGPEIIRTASAKNSDGSYTIKLTTSELAAMDTRNWTWTSTYARLFKKIFNEEELRKGITETLNFKDKYDNYRAQTIKISFESGNIKIDII